MAGGGASSNASRQRKRVDAESDSSSTSLKRARDGSAFTKCEKCQKDVAVALISFHNCSLDAKIKMKLEAQVVEMAGIKKKAATEKKKARQIDPNAKKEKKAENPNRKKRPPTAFLLFMDDFRKSFKEANPDCKKVSTVAKEGGEKWKLLSDDEKKVYTDRAAELKAEYQKASEAENEQDDNDSTENEAKDDSTENEAKDDSTENEAKDDSTENEVKDESTVNEAKDQTNDSSEKEIKVEKHDITEEDVKEEEIEDDE
ncbi:high mobility group B protein 7-like [Salvia hispanica]|uniref:high mobility group B protein 7-like n=1 Tax=Salvia hispanica TaxID=49212 RepID=UPI0020096F70|nr:high mobility group B protein 7-like [Salvia hispanica]